MDGINLKVIIVSCITIWLLLCLYLYTFFRHYAWLAGSVVVSCLFFLGATIAVSFLVKGTIYLVPLWLGISILCAVHLLKARQATLWPKPSFGQIGKASASASSLRQDCPKSYI